MYVSSSGSAAEARANGADDDTAFLYGMLSGSIEVLTEQLGGGIPGLNKGVLDDWLMGMAKSNTGRAALKHLANALGEGAEEFISEIAGAYLAQMWSDEEPDFWQTLGDAFYAGLIGTLTSACMSVPGNLAELNNARTVDTATAAMRNGEVLSGTQLAQADAAMQKLIGPEGSDSPWSRIPAREWKDTKSSYFDSFFPQMAELTGKEANLSGIDLSNVIMLPMVKDTAAQANLTADPNAVSSPATNNMAATQNGQPDLSNVIMLPTGSELEALVRADAEANAASAPATVGNTAMAQNGQPDLSDIIFPPTREQLERWAKEDAQANAASASAANNNATVQNGQPDISNVFFFPTRDQLERWAKEDAEANAASAPAANNNAAAQNGQPNQSNVIHFPTREELEARARTNADSNAISSSTANGIATAQNSSFDLSNVTSSLIGNEIAADQSNGKTSGDNSQQTNPLHNAEIQSKLLPQDIERGIDTQEHEIEIREAEANEQDGRIEQKSETLSKEEKSGMLSEQRGSNIPVTQNAMLSVSVPPSFRPNERLQIRVKEECQRALLRVKGLPLGTEATILFDMNMIPIKNGIFVGEPGTGNVTYNAPNGEFILIHNHPNGETFSIDDIRNFLKDTGPKIMVAIGHNGKAYILEKHSDFNSAEARLLYRNFVRQYLSHAESVETYLALMEDLLKGVEQYGASYYKG